jgi:hypothetical protein
MSLALLLYPSYDSIMEATSLAIHRVGATAFFNKDAYRATLHLEKRKDGRALHYKTPFPRIPKEGCSPAFYGKKKDIQHL